MHLLNSSTLRVAKFQGDKVPPYAILSHTWGKEEDEVLFADMERGSAEGKLGYKKIRYSCAHAAAHGHDYIWVDTCCIDKSSSADLSEAINSMYTWYRDATICYAYLADVLADVDTTTLASPFANSKWFKRGWTLQELIAPPNLVFFSHDWLEIGTKLSLRQILSQITGIDVDILTDLKNLESASVAKRMSWASGRSTTRPEDKAYCLMGIFDVNMPMLYGEGEKAFIRLQEEIMKHSDDQSLFAWIDLTASADSYHGMLAKHPANFAESRHIRPYRGGPVSSPFSMSNKGLSIELPLSPYKDDTYVAALNCPAPPPVNEGWLGIFLVRLSTGDCQYARVKPDTFCNVVVPGGIESVYVRQSGLIPGPQDIYPQHAFQLRKGPAREDGYTLISAVSFLKSKVPATILSSSTKKWVPARMWSTFNISKGNNRLAAALLFEYIDGDKLVVMLGSTMDFGVGFDVIVKSGNETLEELQNLFNPRPSGTNIVLENDQVRVHTEPRIYSGIKYYMVDIVLETLYRPNQLDKIKNIVPGLSTEEPLPDVVGPPSRGFWRLKVPFRSSGVQKPSGSVAAS